MIEKYGGGTISFTWPTALFTEIIRINHLRMRASRHELTLVEDSTHEAYGILSRIHNFSASKWVESKPSSKDEWVLLGNVYKSAVALYCISSLRSLSVLPTTPFLTGNGIAHSQLRRGFLARRSRLQDSKDFCFGRWSCLA